MSAGNCPRCGGDGVVTVCRQHPFWGMLFSTVTCPTCGGDGNVGRRSLAQRWRLWWQRLDDALDSLGS